MIPKNVIRSYLKQQQKPLDSFKYVLSIIKSLAYYDVKKETHLYVDVGPKGLDQEENK